MEFSIPLVLCKSIKLRIERAYRNDLIDAKKN